MRTIRRLLEEVDATSMLGRKHEWISLDVAELKRQPAIADSFIAMIQSSYSKIGGHTEFKNASSFFNGDALVFDAIDIDADPEPDIMQIFKRSAYGKKQIASATDGSSEAKQQLMLHTAKELGTIGNYAEVSDAMAHVLIMRHQVKHIASEAIVRKVLGKEIEWIGAHPEGKYPGYDGWYIRSLGGTPHMKIMVGVPKV